jgi:hypothetical protein
VLSGGDEILYWTHGELSSVTFCLVHIARTVTSARAVYSEVSHTPISSWRGYKVLNNKIRNGEIGLLSCVLGSTEHKLSRYPDHVT